MKFIWQHPRSLVYGHKLIKMEGVTKEIVDEIAKATDGFSGREITKMVVAWHDAAFTTPDAVLNPEIMRRVLSKFQLQHKLKGTWSKEESMIFEKLLFSGEDNLKGSMEER